MCSLTGDIVTSFAHPFNNYPSQPKSMRPSSCAGLQTAGMVWRLSMHLRESVNNYFCGFLARHFRDQKSLYLACHPVWCIVWVVQTQLFAENSNRGRKVSPEKSKSSHSRRFLLEKFEKIEKSKNSKNSKSRKIRSRKVEKFTFQEISARKVEKIEKIEKSEKSKNRKIHIPIHSRRFLLEKSKKSKNSKSRKVENFLIF